MFGTMMQNDVENDKEIRPKSEHNQQKECSKIASKNVMVFTSILIGFDLPKGGPKSDIVRLLRCLFGPWGPSASKNGLQALRNAFL